jgi:hypothetical protein
MFEESNSIHEKPWPIFPIVHSVSESTHQIPLTESAPEVSDFVFYFVQLLTRPTYHETQSLHLRPVDAVGSLFDNAESFKPLAIKNEPRIRTLYT